jgi:[protein-PII] uridylyltransferase
VAVGGYGRGELHPSSDIDIMVLLPKSDSADWQPDIEKLLTFLWDIGLEVGHSVRSIDDCQRGEPGRHQRDATTLFEARLLAGPESLFAGMRRALAPDRLWSVAGLLRGQGARSRPSGITANDTAYNLEPNVKSSPGGLRDIQTIGWVAKRHFGTDTLDELVAHGFLTREELRKLKAGQSFLWKVRFGLHVLTGRREDRLLFDYQIKLAQTVRLRGRELHAGRRAVDAEVLPHRHGRQPAERNAAAAVSRGHPHAKRAAAPHQPALPDSQRLPGGHASEVFARYPRRCSSCSCCCSSTPSCAACAPRPSACRHARLGSSTRSSARTRAITGCSWRSCCAPVGVTHELRRMNLYGVLGRYIPAFGRVVGPHAVRPVPRLHRGCAHACSW